MLLNKTGFTVLEDNDLQARAPSIFAGSAMNGVSDRYTFLPTIEVVRGMRKEGWLPVMASQQRVRLEGRRGFQKHIIRFRHANDITTTRKSRSRKSCCSILMTAARLISSTPDFSAWFAATE